MPEYDQNGKDINFRSPYTEELVVQHETRSAKSIPLTTLNTPTQESLPVITLLPDEQNSRSETKEIEKNGREWFRTAVTLHVYVRSNKDTNGDGDGDIKGVTQSVSHYRYLGIDAVWTSPIHASKDWTDGGYGVDSYSHFNERMFGNVADVREMVDTLHENDLKMIWDFVGNHTSINHPWHKFSNKANIAERRRQSDYDPQKDPLANIYIRRPINPDDPNTPPSNHISFMDGQKEGSAWVKVTNEDGTEEWEYGKFTPGEQADIDTIHNPAVRAYMIKVPRDWIKLYGVDGVRMDVISHMSEKPDQNYTIKQDIDDTVTGMNKYDWEKTVVIDEEVYPFAREFAESARQAGREEGKEIAIIGEVFYKPERGFDHHVGFYDQGILPFNFSLLDAINNHGPNARKLKDIWDRYNAALPEGACPSLVLSNHDQNRRIADIVGPENIKGTMMMLLSLGNEGGSNVVIYNGDQLGMAKGDVVNEENDIDPQGRLQGLDKSRSHSRTAIPWDSEQEYAGFSTTTPWLPVGVTVDGNGIKQQEQDPKSMLNFTADMIKSRKTDLKALQYGQYVPIESRDEEVFSFGRQTDRQNLMININFSDERKIIHLPEGTKAKVIRSTNYERKQTEVPDDIIYLSPHEGCILELVA